MAVRDEDGTRAYVPCRKKKQKKQRKGEVDVANREEERRRAVDLQSTWSSRLTQMRVYMASNLKNEN